MSHILPIDLLSLALLLFHFFGSSTLNTAGHETGPYSCVFLELRTALGCLFLSQSLCVSLEQDTEAAEKYR